tara:strand:- start:251 stop:808 length:558 start_codon:yes stop_codon:yes gene_type:complete
VYLTKEKNPVHQYLGYKSKEQINEILTACILSVLSQNISLLGVFTQFTHKDLFQKLWKVLCHYKIFGRDNEKEAELLCRAEMYKLESLEYIKFNPLNKADHYTISTTLKGNQFLSFLYKYKPNSFYISKYFNFINARFFSVHNNNYIEINLGTEKGTINSAFNHSKTFKTMEKLQKKTLERFKND